MHFPTGLGYLSLYFYPQLQIVLDSPNPFHCIRNGQTMTVNGHVIDGRNTPVDNFPIEITNPASGKVITVTETNSQGKFSISFNPNDFTTDIVNVNIVTNGQNMENANVPFTIDVSDVPNQYTRSNQLCDLYA